MLLLLVNLYFFSIIFTQVTTVYLRSTTDDGSAQLEDETEHRQLLGKYWGSIPRSMLTLFQAVTGGMDWDHASRPIGRLHWTNLPFFLIFFSVTYFAMFNVIT